MFHSSGSGPNMLKNRKPGPFWEQLVRYSMIYDPRGSKQVINFLFNLINIMAFTEAFHLAFIITTACAMLFRAHYSHTIRCCFTMCGLLVDEQCHSVLDHSRHYLTTCYRYPKPKIIDSCFVSNIFFPRCSQSEPRGWGSSEQWGSVQVVYFVFYHCFLYHLYHHWS